MRKIREFFHVRRSLAPYLKELMQVIYLIETNLIGKVCNKKVVVNFLCNFYVSHLTHSLMYFLVFFSTH